MDHQKEEKRVSLKSHLDEHIVWRSNDQGCLYYKSGDNSPNDDDDDDINLRPRDLPKGIRTC